MIETFLHKVFNVVANYSDRFLGALAETWPPGNSPHKVMETVRKSGLIDEALLPFTEDIMSLNVYYAPVQSSLVELGKKWIAKWSFYHAWVFTGGSIEEKQKKLYEAIQFSPIGVSVMAWRFDNEKEVYVKNPGEADTHWCVIMKMEWGKPYHVLDSYDQEVKLLAWDYDFGYAKYISINKLAAVALTFWARLAAWVSRLFS